MGTAGTVGGVLIFEKVRLKTIDLNKERAGSWQKLLEPAADLLMRGGIIAYPTETVYGLGANIFKETAVNRLFEIKQRDPKKPFSVMVASVSGISELCRDVSENAQRLMQKYWPGPLTLVLRASENLPRHIQSRDGKIGVRIPNHPVTAALMKLHHEPITCTSANLTGEPDGVSAGQVSKTLHGMVDLIINGGSSDSAHPSTVVDISEKQPVLLREGTIAFSEILTLLQKG